MKNEENPVLLDAFDALHVLGSRVERDAWCGRFRPEASLESACRAWERFKAGLRSSGLPFGVERQELAADVLVFAPGARAVIERLLDGPPVPAPASPRRVLPVSSQALEDHARALWRTAMWANPAAFARDLERAKPDAWYGRASIGRSWWRRLEQEARERRVELGARRAS